LLEAWGAAVLSDTETDDAWACAQLAKSIAKYYLRRAALQRA